MSCRGLGRAAWLLLTVYGAGCASTESKSGTYVEPRPEDIAAVQQGLDTDVVPINWSDFPNGDSGGTAVTRWKTALRNLSKYALNTWWDGSRAGNSGYVDFAEVFPPSQYAYALAVNIKTGSYSTTVTGVSLADAKSATIKLVKSIAYDHIANRTGTGRWGGCWMCERWAHMTGLAGWLMWDEPTFSATDKEYVRKMVAYEANRFVQTGSMRAKSANEDLVIDTEAEENGWAAKVLELAASMMPNHPNAAIWKERARFQRMTGVARGADYRTNASDTQYSPVSVDGQPAHSWMDGYNYSSTYAVGAHGETITPSYPHPVYSSGLGYLEGSFHWALAGLPIPQYHLYNQADIYAMYVDRNWTFNGTTSRMYKTDGTIFWTLNDEEQNAKAYSWALLDAMHKIFKTDFIATSAASVWEDRHLDKFEAKLQSSTGGYEVRPYCPAAGQCCDPAKENPGCIELVASGVASGYLAHWLANNGFTPPTYPGLADSASSGVTYTGSWATSSNTADYKGSIRYGDTAGIKASRTFSGQRIRFFCRKGPQGGRADIRVDGVLKVSGYDMYAATNTYQVEAYDLGGLDPSVTHTIEVIATGTKNASSGGTNIHIDFFLAQ